MTNFSPKSGDDYRRYEMSWKLRRRREHRAKRIKTRRKP
ncbi:hypothetical protein JDBV01_00320 [Mycobacterium phage mcgavigan]|nr:hypothetical protein JDBV01_00320 [Mycobacterium phage mcgavigan]